MYPVSVCYTSCILEAAENRKSETMMPLWDFISQITILMLLM